MKAITRRSTRIDLDVVKRLLRLRKGAKLFSQGAPADAIFFVNTGKVEVTVTSAYGKEAILRVLGPNDFLGEECLVNGSLRTSTATSIGAATVFRIEKPAMAEALHVSPDFSRTFMASLLTRSATLKQNLCDQILDHYDVRLARVLLRLARSSKRDAASPDTRQLKVSHANLAEMVGASRSRIAFLMNKFRGMGVIHYKGNSDIRIMTELLTDKVLLPVTTHAV